LASFGCAPVRDLYMAYAAQCHKLAEDSEDEAVRAAWLKLAGSWLELANAAQQREQSRKAALPQPDLLQPEFPAVADAPVAVQIAS
jgi:hypothetical protein